MAKAWSTEELTRHASPDFLRANAVIAGNAILSLPDRVEVLEVPARRAINKTEQRFKDEFLSDIGGIVLEQAVRIPLRGGGVYIPDFVVITPDGAMVIEIKGGYRGPGWEQGYERYKRAALEWHRGYFAFEMATFDRKEGGKWRFEQWK